MHPQLRIAVPQHMVNPPEATSQYSVVVTTDVHALELYSMLAVEVISSKE